MANEEKAALMRNGTKKRKPKEVAIFGNYRHYYGYRIGEMTADPRLMVLKKEWFEGKDCLDIGCNQGLITIEIAKSFHCRSICGVDIDASLIDTAYWNLNRIAKMEKASQPSSNASETQLSERTPSLEDTADESSEMKNDDLPKTLLDRVSFQKQNFVERMCKHSEEKYDTIICKSVSRQRYDPLLKGGILVLEPQPWKSYQKNYQVSETATLNYHSITCHPCDFQELLLDKIGFREVESITSSLEGSAAGFNRPLFVFRK